MKKLLLSIIISLFLCTGVYAGPWISGGSSGGSGSGDVTAASTAQTWGDGTGPVVWTFSVTGTDPTISVATGAFTVNTDLALGANDITMTGSLGATGARVTKGWFTDLEVTNAPTINGAAWTTILQPYNAILTAIAGLTPTENAVVGWTTGPTLAALTSHSHSASAAQFYDASAPTKLVKIDPAGNTAGATTTLAFASTADATITFPAATSTLATVDSQVFTTYIEAPYLILGSAATAADAGTIRMPNAGSIQFEADAAGTDINALSVDSSEVVQIGSAGASGVTITPALTLSAQLNLMTTDADPATTAGGIKHDSSDTGASGGGSLKWFDGTNVRTLVDTGTTFTHITKYEYLPIRYAEDDVSVAAPAAAAEIGTTSLIGRSFAEDADNGVIFFWQIPSDYVSGIKYRVYYALNANGQADETAAFSLAGCSVGNSDALACSEGTAVVVTDELGTDDDTGELLVTGWSTAVTITNAAAGEMASLLLIRDVSEDDYSDHLLVSGIEIKYVSKLAPFSAY